MPKIDDEDIEIELEIISEYMKNVHTYYQKKRQAVTSENVSELRDACKKLNTENKH